MTAKGGAASSRETGAEYPHMEIKPLPVPGSGNYDDKLR